MISLVMNPIHIIHGTPAAFEKSVNQLVSKRDVALKLRDVSYHDGRLAGIVEELPKSPTSTGALLSVSVREVKDPAPLVKSLAAENPCWSVVSAFASREPSGKGGGDNESGTGAAAKKASAKGSGVIVVATLSQP